MVRIITCVSLTVFLTLNLPDDMFGLQVSSVVYADQRLSLQRLACYWRQTTAHCFVRVVYLCYSRQEWPRWTRLALPLFSVFCACVYVLNKECLTSAGKMNGYNGWDICVLPYVEKELEG